MRICFVLFAVAGATSSFDDVIQEVMTPPDKSLEFTVESFFANFNDRLARLAAGYAAAVASVQNQPAELNRLRNLWRTTETNLRHIQNEMKQSFIGFDTLRVMAALSYEMRQVPPSVRGEMFDTAYRDCPPVDSLVHQNILLLEHRPVGPITLSLPVEDADGLEKFVVFFEEFSRSLPAEALEPHDNEGVEYWSVRLLTILNLHYLSIRLEVLAHARTDLLASLDAARSEIAPVLIASAETARTESVEKALDAYRNMAEAISAWELTADSCFSLSRIGKLLLDQGTREIPSFADFETVERIRNDALTTLEERCAKLELEEQARKMELLTTPEPFDPDAPRGPLGVLSDDDFLTKVGQVMEWPEHCAGQSAEYYDKCIAVTREELHRLVEALNPSFSKARAEAYRFIVENNIVGTFRKLKKKAQETDAVGQL